MRSSLWNPYIYKILPDIPEAADWPAEAVVEELERRKAVLAAQRRGTDTSPPTNPAASTHSPRPEEHLPRFTRSRASIFAAASSAVTAVRSGSKRKRRSASEPASPRRLDRALTSSKGTFGSWWNETSYRILAALGFDRARADSIHATILAKISNYFKKLYEVKAKAGEVQGTWGSDGSFELSAFDRNPDSVGKLSNYVAAEDMLSVCGNNWATDWAVGTFFLMVSAASRHLGKVLHTMTPTLVPALLRANTTAASLADERLRSKQYVTDYTAKFKAMPNYKHVPLWLPIMLPDHFILFVFLPAENKLLVCDPLGRDRALTRSREVNVFLQWLMTTVGCDRPAVDYLNVPRQSDSTSCGPFCMAYILYALLHDGRPPPASAWSGDNANVIRALVADILLTGKIPLPSGGVFDCAGAGLPSVGA